MKRALVAVLCGLSAFDAHAAIVRLAVITTAIEPEYATSTDMFNAVAEAAGYALDVRVVPRAESSRGELEAALHKCGTDVECISDALSKAYIDLAIIAIADQSHTPVLINSRLVDARGRKVLARELAEVEPNARSIPAMLRAQTLLLFERAELSVGGRVVVETEPRDAQVTIDRVPAATAGTVVLPGEHVVVVSARGFVPRERTVRVERAAELEVKLALEEESIAASPWLWGAIGAAVAVGAGIAIAAAASSSGSAAAMPTTNTLCFVGDPMNPAEQAKCE